MPVETAQYINELNAANPVGSDPKSDADNHLRLIKAALKATFPNLTGPVTATQAQLNASVGGGGDGSFTGGTLTGNLDAAQKRIGNLADPTAAQDAVNKRSMDVAIAKLYPVGAIYISTVGNNPAGLFGFGTWELFGGGRVLVGHGGTVDDNSQARQFTAGAEGGEFQHTLTVAEMPQHTHDIQRKSGGGSSGTNFQINSSGSTFQDATEINAKLTGGNQAHQNMQPYVVVYMWRRTA